MKGENIILNIFMAVCLCIFLYVSWHVWTDFIKYREGEKEYAHLEEYIHIDNYDDQRQQDIPLTQGDDVSLLDKYLAQGPPYVDFDHLKRINSDIVGWIYIPGTEINYPIVQGRDNDYYLHYTFERKKNHTGALFLDCKCDAGFRSSNSIIYGHNMKNGRMFGRLKQLYDRAYNDNADYKEHPLIWIITPDENRGYEIMAVREIDVDSRDGEEAYLIEISDQKEYVNFLEKQKEKSQYMTGLEVNANRHLLTLSTCTSDSVGGRLIVQALEIRTEIRTG